MNVSQIISKEKDNIINLWLDKVKELIPESDSHQRFIIRNDVPLLIDGLCELLRSTKNSSEIHSSRSHGQMRSDLKNYSLTHVIREYHILKKVIFDILDQQTELLPYERNVILSVIDQAIEQAGEAFFMSRQDIKEKARLKAVKLAESMQEEEVLRENFFSGITHDLKNPISNITTAVNYLREQPLIATHHDKMLNIIRISAKRAEILIRDLLDINLIKSGNKLPVHPQKISLKKLVIELLDSMPPDIQKRIQLEVSDEVMGYWDSSLLVRAIDNLLQNALKYGEMQKPIQLKVYSEEDIAVFSVHNEGKPIPEEKKDSLFNRFYRADEEHSTSWGLGLSLVSGIVQAHEGEIYLESEESDGTSFTVRIPCRLTSSDDSYQLQDVEN
ncbi:MAG: ATP-binding protein [Cyclobacteriaceae bacterium]